MKSLKNRVLVAGCALAASAASVLAAPPSPLQEMDWPIEPAELVPYIVGAAIIALGFVIGPKLGFALISRIQRALTGAPRL